MVFAVSLLITLALVAAACSGPGKDGQVKKTLVFADAGWDSIRVHNAIAMKILEHGYGYKTDVMPGSETSSFEGVKNGDIDVYMEVWSGNIIDKYNEAVENSEVLEVSVNYDDNKQGLYVPTYVIKGDPERGIEPMAPDLESIHDLPKYWELFKDPEDPDKGRIYGSIPGWFADTVLAAQVKEFGLDKYFNYFQPGSGTALATSLTTAVKNGEPWVGYYWEPTWISGKYDLTLLKVAPYDDEKWENNYKCDFPSQRLTIIVPPELKEKAPEVVEFLSHYQTSAEITADCLAYMQDNKAAPEDAAEYFLKKYEDLWTKWVPDEAAEKVKAAIQ
ncbi:MAG: ABC transporter substrate-binding protein [Desulfotomaculum sp.]|nr:ABC transporter substrate-binding protein [Desulfotomaculum sp.]